MNCLDFSAEFAQVLNEVNFLKEKVNFLEEKVDHLEEQNKILENKIQKQLKEEIDQFEAKSGSELDEINDKIECITLNTEANSQRLDDVQEVDYSFKYSISSDKLSKRSRVQYGKKKHGTGVDSTGLFTAQIGILF